MFKMEAAPSLWCPCLTDDQGALYSEGMSEKPDAFFMKRAIRLARLGHGKTRPNPMVGAVVVRDGKVVGEDYHHAPGEPHAEVLALQAAGDRARGATLYTTLEPCCHINKRTPPCTNMIIESGIKQVVSAMKDPNPMVYGKGFEALKRAGIKVVYGVMQAESEKLNEVFIKMMKVGRPFVTLKAAMTMDGRIATASGESKWISGEKSRKDVDKLRATADGVLVGIGTVLADDPMLALRKVKGNNPMRIVVDPYLKTPLQSRLVRSAENIPVFILTTQNASPHQLKSMETAGVKVKVLSDMGGEISFGDILECLGQAGVTHLLVEGGGHINGMALRSGLVDRIIFYIAPIFLCGEDAVGVVGGKAISQLNKAISLEDVKIRRLGNDLRVEGRVKNKG